MWQVVGRLTGRERSLRQACTKAGRAAAQARDVHIGCEQLRTTSQVTSTHKLVGQGKVLAILHNRSRYHGERFIEACDLWSNISCVLLMKNSKRLIMKYSKHSQ
jgi:hypothetical protein